MKPVKQCTNCGTSLYNDRGFCPNCGHPVGVSDTTTVQSQTTSYGNNPYAGNPYGNQPHIPPPPPPPTLPSPRKGPSILRTIVIAVIAILVACGLLQGLLHLSQSTTQPPATAIATALPTATDTPIPAPYGGTLVLSDPLQDNSLGNGWYEGDTNFGSCHFVGGLYVGSAPTQGGINCYGSAIYSDFAFEVEMTIIKGDSGGITFRDDLSSHSRIEFSVNSDGSFSLFNSMGTTIVQTLVKPTLNAAINKGFNQPNIIAVVAKGSTITMYVNHKLLASVTDNTYSYSQGKIGILAVPYTTNGQPTEVDYRNAKVWTR